MALVFEPRTDGFRVCRPNGEMVASLQTRVIDQAPPATLPEETIKAIAAKDGPVKASEAATAYANDLRNGVTAWQDLPRGECTIHSAGPALLVAEVEEMLAKLAQ